MVFVVGKRSCGRWEDVRTVRNLTDESRSPTVGWWVRLCRYSRRSVMRTSGLSARPHT